MTRYLALGLAAAVIVCLRRKRHRTVTAERPKADPTPADPTAAVAAVNEAHRILDATPEGTS